MTGVFRSIVPSLDYLAGWHYMSVVIGRDELAQWKGSKG